MTRQHSASDPSERSVGPPSQVRGRRLRPCRGHWCAAWPPRPGNSRTVVGRCDGCWIGTMELASPDQSERDSRAGREGLSSCGSPHLRQRQGLDEDVRRCPPNAKRAPVAADHAIAMWGVIERGESARAPTGPSSKLAPRIQQSRDVQWVVLEWSTGSPATRIPRHGPGFSPPGSSWSRGRALADIQGRLPGHHA